MTAPQRDSTSRADVTLFVDPLSPHFEGDRLFDSRNSPFGGDDILGPYTHLRRRLEALGVRVHTADLLLSGEVPPSGRNLYVTMGMTNKYRKLARRRDVVMSAFFVPECPIAEPRLFRELHSASRLFKRMYCFSGDEAVRPFLTGPVSFRPFRFPQAFDDVNSAAWPKRHRKFLTIINANKLPRLWTNELYTERLRAVAYFATFDEIDLFGIGWDGPPFVVGSTRLPRSVNRLAYLSRSRWERIRPPRDPLRVAARKVARGPVASKAETLSDYTFAICFENMALEGWITEKLFDCLYAGTVPIYLGAPDIDEWVPSDCYIDMRRFSGYEELREHLHALSDDEIEGYRAAGRRFVTSEAFRPFGKDAFADEFVRILEEDT